MQQIAGDIIILLMCTKNHNHDVLFLRHIETECFVILDHFLPIHHPDNLEYQNFEKLKKRPGDIIILHMCTINDNDTVYGSWDRWYIWSATDIIFCHFGSYFALLPH